MRTVKIRRGNVEDYIRRNGEPAKRKEHGDVYYLTYLSADDVKATPGALELAQHSNVDITRVKGTGSGGTITKKDVQRAERELTNG